VIAGESEVGRVSAGQRLPDGRRLFLGDGGLETTMIFREGFELPCFASFPLLREAAGVEALRRYYGDYLEVARRRETGFTLDTPTWRANRDACTGLERPSDQVSGGRSGLIRARTAEGREDRERLGGDGVFRVGGRSGDRGGT
jgi:S-methylmethionine-dependent homocysteine/selenocysteine methylase